MPCEQNNRAIPLATWHIHHVSHMLSRRLDIRACVCFVRAFLVVALIGAIIWPACRAAAAWSYHRAECISRVELSSQRKLCLVQHWEASSQARVSNLCCLPGDGSSSLEQFQLLLMDFSLSDCVRVCVWLCVCVCVACSNSWQCVAMRLNCHSF